MVISNIFSIFAIKLILNIMMRRRYNAKHNRKIAKNPQQGIDVNVYTYNDRMGTDGKLEWASVGVLETAQIVEGVQLTSEI